MSFSRLTSLGRHTLLFCELSHFVLPLPLTPPALLYCEVLLLCACLRGGNAHIIVCTFTIALVPRLDVGGVSVGPCVKGYRLHDLGFSTDLRLYYFCGTVSLLSCTLVLWIPYNVDCAGFVSPSHPFVL